MPNHSRPFWVNMIDCLSGPGKAPVPHGPTHSAAQAGCQASASATQPHFAGAGGVDVAL